MLVWRRSYDIAPNPLAENDLRNPRFDYRYHEVPAAELPRTESLKDTIERIMPYWESNISVSYTHLDVYKRQVLRSSQMS